MKISYLLLLFVPLSLVAAGLHWGAALVFCTSALAIIPLASWLSTATEEIAVVLGPSWGGLLNATLGNATELIIGIVALKSGLVSIVKASLTGSIIGNLLLVMGLSMFLGGLRFKEQTFQPTMARVNASVMNLAVVAILLPTGLNFLSAGSSGNYIAKIVSGSIDRVDFGLYFHAPVFHEDPCLPLRLGHGRTGRGGSRRP
jgi:Ca2+:H+ antiporter